MSAFSQITTTTSPPMHFKVHLNVHLASPNLPIILARTYVYDYHEDDLDPPSIGPTTFFVRTTLLHRKKQLKVGGPQCTDQGASGRPLNEHAWIQPPLGHNTCSCREAYNPYPAPVLTGGMVVPWVAPPQVDSRFLTLTCHPRSSEPPDTMHFCPSVNCRKWYHSNCLVLMQHLDTTSHPATRAIRLLANDPDSEAPFVMFGHFSESESREIVPDSTEQVSTIAHNLILSLVPFPQSVV